MRYITFALAKGRLAKKTLDAEKEKEADKQKGIYAAMGKFTIVRN